jgi:acyl-CoA thioester hydrolase
LSLSGEITNGTHRVEIRVYYEDTDHSGRVYHANYLKFCERGRSETLKLVGIRHTALQEQDLYFIVRSMVCDFRSAAQIDDIVTVTTTLKEASGARFVLDQQVMLDGVVLFQADVTLAMINSQGRPQRIPRQILDAMPKT